MSRRDSALLVVDVQEKLVSLIPGHARLVWNIRRLLDGALMLGVPVAATEQYPQKLGPSVPEVTSRIATIPEKRMFSCRECQPLFADLRDRGIRKLLVVGIEAHVCILQTVYDLLAEGFHVHLAVDAIGSRFPLDCEIAIRRLESSGATLTTTEAALFEWCETSAAPEFKQISALVRESPPAPLT